MAEEIIESTLSTEDGDKTTIKKDGDDGNWYDSFGEDNADHFKGFESMDTFLEDLKNVKGKVPVIPESVDEYTFEKPEDHPYPVSDEALKAFATKAHEAGMTPKQFQAVVDYQLQVDRSQHAAAMETLKKDEALLKSEWGEEFKGNLTKATQVMNGLFGDDFKNVIKTFRLGDNPAFVKGMHKLSTLISEDKFVPGFDKKDKSNVKRDPITGERLFDYSNPVRKIAD